MGVAVPNHMRTWCRNYTVVVNVVAIPADEANMHRMQQIADRFLQILQQVGGMTCPVVPYFQARIVVESEHGAPEREKGRKRDSSTRRGNAGRTCCPWFGVEIMLPQKRKET